MRNAIRALLICVAALSPLPAGAWDYPGHRIVGAIADLVLSSHDPDVYNKVMKLLATKDASGNDVKRTLSQVAVFPDCAKPDNELYCGRPPSEEEKGYVRRNPHNGAYHYTDIPLGQSSYVAYSPGTEEDDVVQMIKFAVKQLRAKSAGDKPKMRDVSLTDAEALWLLAHLVGDIHQPLHVGAMFFDKETCTTAVDPNTVPGGMANVASTTGGNDIKLVALAPAPAVPPADNLHFFWDGAAVAKAMQADGLAGSEQEFARLLASEAPANWQSAGDPDTWAEQWAADIMPLARDAHDPARLTIALKERKVSPAGKVTCTWNTQIKPEYSGWGKDRAREQLRKAGFRLAALIEAIFKP